MTNILLDARQLLDDAGYRTLLAEPNATFFYFEDLNVLGVVHAIPSVSGLLTEWEALQDAFLRDNAARLAADALKAWNCYSVFLSSGPCVGNQASLLFSIEENFRGTRKLARAGLGTRLDVEGALASLLPLRRVLPLAQTDIRARLESRLAQHGSALALLLTEVPTKSICESLLESQ